MKTKEIKETWYEVAVSYTNDDGTETIERKTTLNEAIDYAKNCSELKDKDVDFVFIDKWNYDGNDVHMDNTFKSQIITKNLIK